jgi:hypothetical protein
MIPETTGVVAARRPAPEMDEPPELVDEPDGDDAEDELPELGRDRHVREDGEEGEEDGVERREIERAARPLVPHRPERPVPAVPREDLRAPHVVIGIRPVEPGIERQGEEVREADGKGGEQDEAENCVLFP